MDEQKSTSDLSLIRLLRQSGSGDVSEGAATEFYARYMQKLMSLVERNLASRFGARIDPEDILQTVFRTWFRQAKEGRIDPGSQDEIWKLLSVIALNKVRNKVKFHDAQRRSVGRTQGNQNILGAVPEPSADDATEFLDMVETAGQQMSDNARLTLQMILEGKSNQEIAAELGRTTKSVGRYKKEIGTIVQKILNVESDESEDHR